MVIERKRWTGCDTQKIPRGFLSCAASFAIDSTLYQLIKREGMRLPEQRQIKSKTRNSDNKTLGDCKWRPACESGLRIAFAFEFPPIDA
jgi:hypothetical protein